MSRCLAELCLSWTGDGCACAVFGITPVNVGETCPFCQCSLDDHNHPDLGGDCTSCGECP